MVYVDNLISFFGSSFRCHMAADTTEELLEMATKIGIDHRWLQKDGTWKEHFDVCRGKREKAVALGAKEVTTRELLLIMKDKK
jgi:hypothetical protein